MRKEFVLKVNQGHINCGVHDEAQYWAIALALREEGMLDIMVNTDIIYFVFPEDDFKEDMSQRYSKYNVGGKLNHWQHELMCKRHVKPIEIKFSGSKHNYNDAVIV